MRPRGQASGERCGDGGERDEPGNGKPVIDGGDSGASRDPDSYTGVESAG
jgi:hypothetical protein